MAKKVLLVIFSLLLVVSVFIIVLFFVNRDNGKGALQVTSSPVSKVYLDGKLIGESPICKCEGPDMIPNGIHTIRLVPTQGNFDTFEHKIAIASNVLTVVDRTFADSGLSEGSVINLTPLIDKKDSQIMVISFPDKALVSLDSNTSGITPLILKNQTVSDHEIKLSKEGYKEKIIRIRTVKGYKLEAVVFLAVNPEGSASSALPSVSPTPNPKEKETVLILSTPTGFLRVRETPSTSAKEIARVSPDDELELISEQTGWFEVKLADGKTGFISSQYARKQTSTQ